MADISDEDFTQKYRLATEQSCFYDRSERGKLALTGTDAKEFLNGVITNDAELLKPGHGLYAAFLTPKGKMLGDLRVSDTGEELLLDTERIALQALFDELRKTNIGFDATIHKRTLEEGLVSVIGPQAREKLQLEVLPSQEHCNRFVTIDTVYVLAIATNLGVDLFCDAEHVDDLKKILLNRGISEVSEDVIECLRIESGRPRFGVDIDENTIPQEAGLNERAVSFTKGCYIGQETVARLYYKGKPNRHLRGLKATDLFDCETLFLAEREVGRVSSLTLSPRFGWIGLALLRREVQPESTVKTRSEQELIVCELPFTN